MDGRSGRAPAWLRDPVLGVLAAVGAVIVAVYGFSVGPDRLRDLMFWPIQAPLDLTFAILSHRVATSPASTPAERRFWAALRTAGAFFVLADTYQITALLAGREDGWLPALDLQPLLAGLGVLRVIWATLVHPVQWTGRDRVRLWLDLVTVIVGVGTFTWYLWLGSEQMSAAELLVSAFVAALMLVSTFGLCKLLLGGQAPFTTLTGISGAMAAALFALGVALPPALLEDPLEDLVRLAWLAPGVQMAITPRLQLLALRRRTPGRPCTEREPRRGAGWLPYLAMVATQGLLIVAVVRTTSIDRGLIGVLTGVTGIIGLIVVRQVMVLRDNAALVSRLDDSLRELAGFQDRLWHEARHDQLTQLANRTLLYERIDAAAAGPGPEQAALLLLDLNRFKAVNDTLGHHVGDALLVHVAGRLRAGVRGGDTVARLGGDEFVVLMPGASREDAQALAQRLHEIFAGGVTIEGHRLDVGASIGIAIGLVQDADDLLREADAEMYRAKQVAHATS